MGKQITEMLKGTLERITCEIWIALAWCVGILVVAYFFAMLTYRRKIA